MVDSMQPLDWDLLNTDQKYEFCGKSVHRSVTDIGLGFSTSGTVCNYTFKLENENEVSN